MSSLALVALAAAASCVAPDGLRITPGWCASVFHEGVGPARHLVVDAGGNVFVRLRTGSTGGIVVLRDSDGDGHADSERRFEASGGTGIGVHEDYLYASSATEVFRYRLGDDRMLPIGERESVVSDLPGGHSHDAKSLTFDEAGWMYVNLGTPSNACQRRARSAGSPGLDPCPQLQREGGIWRFRADTLGQSQDDGERYATGIRNAVAIDFDPRSGSVWVVQHGRDQLDSLWPERFDAAYNAENPGEELIRLEEGGDYGWPYCYWSREIRRRVLAPEYGGDGEVVGRCSDSAPTSMSFPGHWAPNDLLFVDRGALIAFHGSWNRAPFPQQGYRVAFVAFDDAGDPLVRVTVGGPEVAVQEYQDFAVGFAGSERINRSSDARYRPMGLAQGPDGEIYIADSRVGRIWKLSRRP
jgi:glucose/arabinose dehydrogenase